MTTDSALDGLVTYRLIESEEDDSGSPPLPIAAITLDDGKANVMSLAMIKAIAAGLDRAEVDGAVVKLTGRLGFFSAGYDLAMFQAAEAEILSTLTAGGDLVLRILRFPFPVVVACSGHAVAQGAFVMLAADSRLAADGAFKIGLNEVAIGLTIPWYGIEAARGRLTPSGFNHATTTGALYSPVEALQSGFVDRVVEAVALEEAALDEAKRLARLDMGAHLGTKLRTRCHTIDAIEARHPREFSPQA